MEINVMLKVISNVTWNPELLTPGGLEDGSAVLLVGNDFSGCIHEGPQLEFHAAQSHIKNVQFRLCPLATDECEHSLLFTPKLLILGLLCSSIFCIQICLLHL